ncbi:tyrosine-type recombinase/integrase [Streptomyces sp. NPDC053560]|uniref:tyrosine-type recombinase/integrase n=1 Tax=Streptomyces sp. NPDC053560 TaxID=3365711 RepID=UPI0037D0975F
MAYIATRKNKAGEVTSYQVKWRLNGSRSAPQQSERFDDEDSAKVFRAAVDDNGQQWPPGWVKGKGFIDGSAGEADDAKYRFDHFARESIKNRTGIEDRYRDAILKELETYILPTFGNCDVRSTDHFSKATVGAWINQMAKTKVWRGSKHKPMSAKTLKNLHGLLSSILREAVQAEPPLRARNPCELTRLPRMDEDGIDEDDDGGEHMEFLTPDEVEGVVSCLTRPEDRRLVRVKYATGMRWGEITALAKRHVLEDEPGKPKLRVARAWKRSKERGYYLGKPKSKRSRRTLRVSTAAFAELVEHGLYELTPSDLIFCGADGGRLAYSTFYDRWQIAVALAKERGLLPSFKQPTLHDLRHSHASALLSAGHSLTYVQRRLGHESITTTSDRYGHLLPEADDAAMATIDRSLGGDQTPELVDAEPVAPMPTNPVFAVHLGAMLLGFWKREHAETTAAGWAQDAGGPVRVETWSLEWWQRQVLRGVHEVRSGVPERVWLWEVGPARYGADGAEYAAGAGVHELSGRWVWDWESGYTEEPAEARAEWVKGEPVTEAAAWGLDRDAVEAAYAQARTDALRVCGLNPAAVGTGREDAVSDA